MGDIEYWNSYYKMKRGVHYPSPFSEFCESEYLDNNCTILELGSGNGRDAFFFAEKGHKVIGYDQSPVVIDENISRALEFADDGLVKFFIGDFTKITKQKLSCDIDVVYSRFTMHSIDKTQEEALLNNIFTLLPAGGIFLIEARTTLDPLYGQGVETARNSFVTDHFRRFIDTKEFLTEVMAVGYKVSYFAEKNGFAPFKDDDPVVARFVLRKL